MRNYLTIGRLFAGVIVFAAVAMACASGESAAERKKVLDDYRVSCLAEAKNAGKEPNYPEIQQKVQAKAQELVKDVDVKSVNASEGDEWAMLFLTAARFTEARDLALKYAGVSTDPDRKFAAQSLAVNASYRAGDLKTLGKLLTETTPSGNTNSFRFASVVVNYAGVASPELGYEKTFAAMDRAMKLVKEDGLSEAEKKQFTALKDTSGLMRVQILSDLARKKEALAEIDRLLPSASPTLAARLKPIRAQLTIVGSVAPALTVERSQGAFTGLDQYKGKVVIVDFFAHWCGPCKASYPEMRKMYDDLHANGLEIVGVTTYYGWYGTPNNKMDKDAEFAKMADFIKEFNIAWPVAFGDHSNFEAYGVSGIPHVAVIDRNGKVHSYDIGYSPALFKKFRAEVEKLVNEGK